VAILQAGNVFIELQQLLDSAPMALRFQ